MKHFSTKLTVLLSVLLLIACIPANAENILYEDFSSITTGNSTSTSGSSSTWAGNTNFPTVAKAYKAGGAVRLGIDGTVGSITSMPLDLSVNSGEFKVKLKIKGWATGANLTITVGSLASQTVTSSAIMTNTLFDEVEVSFMGGTASSTITIATTTTSYRAFIDEVTVYYGGSGLSNDATLSDIKVDGTTLTGFTSTSINYFVTLPSTTTATPVVTATTTHTNASASITQATVIPETATINVTAENTTTTKQYTLYFSKEAAEGEKGSKTNPYTVAEAKTNQYPSGTTTKYWVSGYIIGSVGTAGTPFSLNTTDVATNIALADASTETDVNNMIAVELPTGKVRTALNILNTPTNKGAKVEVYGILYTYFGAGGVINTSDYVLDGTTKINAASTISSIFSDKGAINVILIEEATIQIINLQGITQTIEGKTGNNTINLPKGVYIVKVGFKATKVIVK